MVTSCSAVDYSEKGGELQEPGTRDERTDELCEREGRFERGRVGMQVARKALPLRTSLLHLSLRYYDDEWW